MNEVQQEVRISNVCRIYGRPAQHAGDYNEEICTVERIGDREREIVPRGVRRINPSGNCPQVDPPSSCLLWVRSSVATASITLVYAPTNVKRAVLARSGTNFIIRNEPIFINRHLSRLAHIQSSLLAVKYEEMSGDTPTFI